MENTQDLQCGKMSPEHLAVTKEKISEPSLKKWSKSSNRQPLCLRFRSSDGLMPTVIAETDGALLTEFLTLNYRFWHDVRNTHADINGKAVKEYDTKQMLAWYNKLHTDSSEYKMWGNGIALPAALYVIQGISYVKEGTKND